MRIGIFGGSFNPPHKMHESIATQLIDKGLVDKVIFVPTSNFYPKAGLISDEDRYQMLLLMIENKTNLSLSNYEFGRLTYTYETLEYFQEQNKDAEIYFICGSDNLEEMDTWREYKSILTKFKLIVIPRKHDMNKLLEKYHEYQHNIKIVELENNYLSSTIVRKYLKEKDYESVKEFINEKVLDYIKNNNLYL